MLSIFDRGEKDTALQRLIDKVELEMDNTDVNSDEFQKLMTQLERLYDVKANKRHDSVSADTLALVLGNLAGILLIVAYEQKHVITSKGFAQIIRPKRLD